MANWFDSNIADVFGTAQADRISSANKALANAQAKAEESSAQNKGLYQDYYDTVSDTYGDTASKLSTYLSNLENQEAYDPGEFTFDKDVEDYYSKFANQRAKAATNAIRENNDIFSSDFNDAIAAKQQALASEEWDNAYDRYLKERQQAANEWTANTNAQNTAYSNAYNKNKDLLSTAQTAQDNITNAYGNYISNMTNQNNIDTQNYSNFVQQQAANNNTSKGLFGRLFG